MKKFQSMKIEHLALSLVMVLSLLSSSGVTGIQLVKTKPAAGKIVYQEKMTDRMDVTGIQ